MKEHSRLLLDKAERAIAAARHLLDHGDIDFGAGRAYYAMFYVAEALLHEEGEIFRRHGQVHAAFGRIFVKSGRIDTKFHRWLLDAFDRRLTADYGVRVVLEAEEVDEMIRRAEEFRTAVRGLLERRSGPSPEH